MTHPFGTVTHPVNLRIWRKTAHIFVFSDPKLVYKKVVKHEKRLSTRAKSVRINMTHEKHLNTNGKTTSNWNSKKMQDLNFEGLHHGLHLLHGLERLQHFRLVVLP